MWQDTLKKDAETYFKEKVAEYERRLKKDPNDAKAKDALKYYKEQLSLAPERLRAFKNIKVKNNDSL